MLQYSCCNSRMRVCRLGVYAHNATTTHDIQCPTSENAAGSDVTQIVAPSHPNKGAILQRWYYPVVQETVMLPDMSLPLHVSHISCSSRKTSISITVIHPYHFLQHLPPRLQPSFHQRGLRHGPCQIADSLHLLTPANTPDPTTLTANPTTLAAFFWCFHPSCHTLNHININRKRKQH